MHRLLASSIYLVLTLLLPLPAALSEEPPSPRGVLLRAATFLLKPWSAPAAAESAWRLAASGTVDGKKSRIEVAWDPSGRRAVDIKVEGTIRMRAGFGDKESWIHIPEHDTVFYAAHREPLVRSLAAASPAWSALHQRLPAIHALLALAPLPAGITVDEPSAGAFRVRDAEGRSLELAAPADGKAPSLRLSLGAAAEVLVDRWSETSAAALDDLVARPIARVTNGVEAAHLAGMLETASDMLAERALAYLAPDAVPSPIAGVPRDHGAAVLRLAGSPEAMGRRHGEVLRDAIHYNMHRIFHGVGLLATVSSGRWFPDELDGAWRAQERYIPERLVREIDACSDAAGIPRRWGRAANVFPELFHCSGIAVRGKATKGGALLHGRVLDYMSEIGLQNTAVVMVFEPEGHNAWVSVSYAGLCSTVTAMNAKGLAMGEMGGRGEGHLDGMPMSILMREVMERFETTAEALAWIRATPRTCEYYYVLSDAKTGSMAGVASLARTLAAERGVPDLRIVEPGVSSPPELPHAIEDAVLMSADSRYERLVSRVREKHGALDMQGVWDLLAAGVAMKSNLHTVLFAPESLDFWVAQAGLRGEPAYTQEVRRLNLRDLLARPELGAATTARAVGSE